MCQLIDTHAHLDMAQFSEDRGDVIARARVAGVNAIITVGIDLKSSQQVIGLAEHNAEVSATVGFHPHNATGVSQEDITNLAKLAKHPRVVAVGEAGLDFYRKNSPRKAQLQVLKWQLELATKLDLPLIIHCRQAENDILRLLHDWTSSHKQLRGVIHCFSGDIETAQHYLDMGFFISLGAYIGYPTSLKMHNVISSLPQDRIML